MKVRHVAFVALAVSTCLLVVADAVQAQSSNGFEEQGFQRPTEPWKSQQSQDSSEPIMSWTEPPSIKSLWSWPKIELVAGYGVKSLSWNTSSPCPEPFRSQDGKCTLGKLAIQTKYQIAPSTIQQLTVSGRIEDVELGLAAGGRFLSGGGFGNGLASWLTGYIGFDWLIAPKTPVAIWLNTEAGEFKGVFTAQQGTDQILQPFSTKLIRYRLDLQPLKEQPWFFGLRHEQYHSPQPVYVGFRGEPSTSYVTDARFRSWDFEIGYNSLLPFRQKYYEYNGFFFDGLCAIGFSSVRLSRKPQGVDVPSGINTALEGEFGYLFSKRFSSLNQAGIIIKAGLSGNLSYLDFSPDSGSPEGHHVEIQRVDTWWGPTFMIAMAF